MRSVVKRSAVMRRISVIDECRSMLQDVAFVCFEFESLAGEVLSKTAKKKHQVSRRSCGKSSKASSECGRSNIACVLLRSPDLVINCRLEIRH